ncbi:hypothetical protein FHX74_001793 [Friedmanniella endophytica]|uniref:Pyridinium-3,5-bisthiocarboxylic acid mononucleotide nickel insertion protein n=1 Tax=Microlunatus kandeliicorticis TaxID=1759536 RepID=A0A7W3P5R5_9ACTN|nr:nickel pincer cofactor biosynthesis protein LarC [Microlunatus kandeliicorticis]MBA8794188.1 hypothetical protein [Microlunatus kandeliicorticis]
MTRHLWIDASAGVAGDMLLGALIDAGAALPAVQAAVDAVVSDSVRLEVDGVQRAGLRATKADVIMTVDDPPHRTWSTIRTMITDAGLEPPVRDHALATFAALAEAEGRVHGIPADSVHFHEVGALDSIADVVGVCAALHDLGVESVSAGPVALGSGRTRAAHGSIPVPVPAVTELSTGWRVTAGGEGELTTPTGMALVVTLAERSEDLPGLVVERAGAGAGTKDFPGRANVTRVIIGERQAPAAAEDAVVIEANVDDLDPRVWPDVISRLLAAGADDAWLTPVIMKKGRPAHTLSVLARPDRAAALRSVITATTPTFGLRQSGWTKFPATRAWHTVTVTGGEVRIKIAHADGVITRATPEFDDVAALAVDRPVLDVLTEANAAAVAAGLVPGRPLPAS